MKVLVLLGFLNLIYIFKAPTSSTVYHQLSIMRDIPLVTFTNHAQIYFVKHFVCNLARLGLSEQLIVIASDQRTFSQLEHFQQNGKVYKNQDCFI